MEPAEPARILVVAHRTAATPALLTAVWERASEGPAVFTLLVPNAVRGLHRAVDAEDADTAEAQLVLDLALPLLSEAVGGEVDGMIGDANPIDAVADALNLRGFDELIVSTLPTRVSRWLHMDLPSKLRGMGLPVRMVIAKDATPAAAAGAPGAP